MSNIVRFAIALMALIMLGFIAVMYMGLSETPAVSIAEGQTEEQVRSWMEKNFTDKDREIVSLGKECRFEGEDRRYRLVNLRVKGEPASVPPEQYVVQSKPNGVVTFHWPLAEFITEKKNSSKTETTPERVAWLEKRWTSLAKEMGIPNWDNAGGKPPQAPAQ